MVQNQFGELEDSVYVFNKRAKKKKKNKKTKKLTTKREKEDKIYKQLRDGLIVKPGVYQEDTGWLVRTWSPNTLGYKEVRVSESHAKELTEKGYKTIMFKHSFTHNVPSREMLTLVDLDGNPVSFHDFPQFFHDLDGKLESFHVPKQRRSCTDKICRWLSWGGKSKYRFKKKGRTKKRRSRKRRKTKRKTRRRKRGKMKQRKTRRKR